MDIKKTDLVLEIGSGHNPYPRSNILCDRFLFNNNQRADFAIRYDRPLVIARGEKLPFKNKVFDYVICSQVIEHSSNPLAFAKEMERVGKRGVIICPHAIRERLFGWKYHQWYIVQEKGQLIFIPKKEKEANVLGQFFHQLYQKKTFFRRFCLENNNKLNIFYYWQRKIKIKVENQKPDFEKWEKQLEQFLKRIDFSVLKDIGFYCQELSQRFFNKTCSEIRKSIWQIRKIRNPGVAVSFLRDLICCPVCHSDLKLGRQIICQNCGKKYSIVKGIPVLLD